MHMHIHGNNDGARNFAVPTVHAKLYSFGTECNHICSSYSISLRYFENTEYYMGKDM